MRKSILDRYARTDEGKLILDIAADKVEDLYNNFDKHTPYARKELDQNLVDYLIDSVGEMAKSGFIIQFRLSNTADMALQERVKASINSYFGYLKELEFRDWISMRRSSYILFMIGVAILVLSVWYGEHMSTDESVISHVFSEGLTVAAWVSLWNAIATFLINWAPHHKKIRLYQRISSAEIVFHDMQSVEIPA